MRLILTKTNFYRTSNLWDRADYETIRDEIRNERLYGQRPDLEPSPSKASQHVGIIMIITGLIMIGLIFAVFYPLVGNAIFLLGLICFPLPIFFIVVGILLLYNKRSGKLMFAMICIVFGGGGFVVSLLSFAQGEYNEGSGGLTAISFGIMIYGVYLFKRHFRG
jgi:hypothetical protein